MGYPELDPDEPIILESRNVKFKSISVDARLTKQRIHLTASKKNIIASQDIILATIVSVEKEENAIRDHFLILSVVTDAGEKHKEILSFTRLAGVERKRECNEWEKKLKSLIPQSILVTVPSDISESDREPLPKREVPTLEQRTATTTHPATKKIEISHAKVPLIEKNPVAHESVETTSLPFGSFCSRCGNSVPLTSLFCNYCGTLINHPSGLGQESRPVVSKVKVSVQPPTPQPAATMVREPGPLPSPQPAVTMVRETRQPPTLQPTVTMVRETGPLPTPQPAVTTVKETGQPPSGFPGGRRSSGIAQIIHPIEPLIKDSVPQTQQHSDLVQQSEPSSTLSRAGSSPLLVWPVFSNTESPTTPVQKAAPAGSAAPPPRQNPVPEGKKPYSTIGILIIAILPILIGLVIVANIISGPLGGPANTTPAIPITATILNQSTTQENIPSSGVWVRASYAGTYIGLVGSLGNQIEVNDTGDHFYQIPRGEKTVAAALQKKDSSGNQIILEVYNDGVMLKRETSIAPEAIVEIQLEVKVG
jgi:hypothetical protein